MRTPKQVPVAVDRRARLIGNAHGTSQVTALTFIGLLVTRIADDLDTTDGIVKGAARVALFVVLGLTLGQILLRLGVFRAWVTVACYEAAAVALLMVAVFPSVPALYVGAVFAALPLMALTPLRTAVTREFGERNLDGTFTGRTRAWSYVTRVAVVPTVALAAFLLPHGWRIATAGLGVWVGVVGVMLVRARLPEPIPAAARTSLRQLRRVMRAKELRKLLLALFCSNFILQLTLLNVEPFLAQAGLGRWAIVAVGALSIVPLAALPLIVRLGDLSNDRVWRSAAAAALILAASGLFALGTLKPLPLIVLIGVTVVARAVVEAGVGPLNDAVRTYASRQAPEADALATLLTVAAYYVGAEFSVLFGWRASVVAWLGASVLTVVLTYRHQREVTWRHKVKRARKGEVRIRLRRFSGTDARVRLRLSLGGCRPKSTDAKEGDLLRIITPLDPSDPKGATITVVEVVFRARWEPRRPRKAYGRLFRLPVRALGARFVCVRAEDGKRFGIGRWKDEPGKWRINERMVTILKSPDLKGRPLQAVLYSHNA